MTTTATSKNVIVTKDVIVDKQQPQKILQTEPQQSAQQLQSNEQETVIKKNDKIVDHKSIDNKQIDKPIDQRPIDNKSEDKRTSPNGKI